MSNQNEFGWGELLLAILIGAFLTMLFSLYIIQESKLEPEACKWETNQVVQEYYRGYADGHTDGRIEEMGIR